MLAIDKQPVKSGAGTNFGTEGFAKPEPQAEQGFTLALLVLEGVNRYVHEGF